MSSVFLLIPISIALLLLAIWAFFWAVGSGQFDDLDTPAWRVVLDDDRRPDQTAPPDSQAAQPTKTPQDRTEE